MTDEQGRSSTSSSSFYATGPDYVPWEMDGGAKIDLVLDKETYNCLFATAYDRRDYLWKLIYSTRRYSEREDQPHRIEGVNAFLPTSDIVVNVVTATGVRVEFFDAQPTRMRRGLIRKAIDIGRLSRQGR